MSQNTLDSLEGALFQDRIAQAIGAAERRAKLVGLLMISFDVGENIGLDGKPLFSQFLETASRRLRSSQRDSDSVCRIDTLQIAVLLPSLTSPDDALAVAKKILHTLEQLILAEGVRMDLQPRVGIAFYPDHGNSVTALMQCAETALIRARRIKQSYALYSPEPCYGQRPPIRLSELRQAILQDQLFLEYQPKVNLRNNSFDGVEVLTRWNHPEHGFTSPDQFIPIAERTGLIVPLTLWVLHHAFVQCRSWSDLGFDVGVAVNLSMANLDVLELPAQIEELLKRIDVSADRVELEITESAIMDDPHRAMHILNSIKTLGVRFTIDDFGTGYSSLTHLKKLPVACIKIDKSFVQNMETDKDNAVIVRSIIDLGHNLGLKVIAEGVETPEAKEMLAAFGCDEAQGYLFSHPLPAPEITRLLHRSAFATRSRNPNAEHSSAALGPLISQTTTVPDTNLASLLVCK